MGKHASKQPTQKDTGKPYTGTHRATHSTASTKQGSGKQNSKES